MLFYIYAISAFLVKFSADADTISHQRLMPLFRQCQDDVKIPLNFVADDHDNYKFVESTMQIYTEIQIPCDGFLTQWEFITKNPVVSGLHLAVFRSRPSNERLFDIVGESYLYALKAADDEIDNSWAYYPVKQPIAVERGDVVGMYYDSFASVTKTLTIRSKSSYDIVEKAIRPTYVLLMDKKTLGKNKTVDTTYAYVDHREPALAAVISQTPEFRPAPRMVGGVAEETTTQPTSTPLDRIGYHNEEYYYDDGHYYGQYFTENSPLTTTQELTTILYSYYEGDDYHTTDDEVMTTTTPVTSLTAMAPTSLASVTAIAPTPMTSATATAPASITTTTINNSSAEVTTNTSVTTTSIIRQVKRAPAFVTGLPSVCLNPPSALPMCTQKRMRTFFDYETATCKIFYGCESWDRLTSNNFDTVLECLMRCPKYMRKFT